MELLAFSVIIIVIILYIPKGVNILTNSNGYDKSENNYSKDVKYADDYYLSNFYNGWESKGYERVRISGTSFRGLSKKDVGTFKGKAVAEKNNKYDDYAIAIYTGSNKHVGYAPAGDSILHSYILKKGGSVEAVGYINGNAECYWGEAYIEFNETEWAESLPDEEKVYVRPNLRKHYAEILDMSVPLGKFEGVAKIIEGRFFPIAIYNNQGVHIGVLKEEMNLYYTLKLKENGEVKVWGIVNSSGLYVYIPVLCGAKKIANAKEKFDLEYPE